MGKLPAHVLNKKSKVQVSECITFTAALNCLFKCVEIIYLLAYVLLLFYSLKDTPEAITSVCLLCVSGRVGGNVASGSKTLPFYTF